MKLRLLLTLYLSFVKEDRKRIKSWLYVGIVIGAVLLAPVTLAIVIISSVLSSPLLPLFTLPLFLMSFPRTRRFWPSLINYGSSYIDCKERMYYQVETSELLKVLGTSFSTEIPYSAQPGDYLLLRHQDSILIATILEAGHGYITLSFRGLELQETSCHTIEATRINEIFSTAYSCHRPRLQFNAHLLNVLQPIDSVVVNLYSIAQIVLTGIIDQPHSLERFSSDLLKCIIWVLYNNDMKTNEEKKVEGKQKKGRIGQNVVVPMVESDATGINGGTERVDSNLTGPEHKTGAHGETSAIIKPGCKEMEVSSWNSWSSTEDEDESNKNWNLQNHRFTLGKIPVDLPLSPSTARRLTHKSSRNLVHAPSQLVKSSLHQSHHSLIHPHGSKLKQQVDETFPNDWLTHLCKSSSNQPPMSDVDMENFKRRCLKCFHIMNVPHCSTVSAKTSHIYNGFFGKFPTLNSSDLDWLNSQEVLKKLTMKAYRYIHRTIIKSCIHFIILIFICQVCSEADG